MIEQGQETVGEIEAQISKTTLNGSIYEVKQFGTTLFWSPNPVHAESCFNMTQQTAQLWQIQGNFKRLIKEKINGSTVASISN